MGGVRRTRGGAEGKGGEEKGRGREKRGGIVPCLLWR